ncbi:hypothetical protein ACFXJO_16315 [Streptomyces lavendulae]|uniref:hypothetical protein n=1 Tax=Streptomyces lavendulae TaxID=1914 RepID=UPI0036B9BDF8
MRVAALMFLVAGLADLWTGTPFLGAPLIAVAILHLAMPFLIRSLDARRDANPTAQ